MKPNTFYVRKRIKICILKIYADKKYTKIQSCRVKLLESPKQGKGLKKVILIWSKGTEVGMFDEHGSVEASDITEVFRDGRWHLVTGHPKDQEWDPDAYLDSVK